MFVLRHFTQIFLFQGFSVFQRRYGYVQLANERSVIWVCIKVFVFELVLRMAHLALLKDFAARFSGKNTSFRENHMVAESDEKL